MKCSMVSWILSALGARHFMAVLTLLLTGMGQPSAQERDVGGQKLRIGIITPLTGGVAVWGLSVRRAIELANSSSPHPAELIFEDEETCSAAKALSAYNALRTMKKVDVLVSSCLEGAQAIAPMAERDRMPFFIAGRSSLDFQRKHPNALSWLSLLDYEGNALGDLIASRNWKRGTAMVWSGYFGVQFADAIGAAVAIKAPSFKYLTIEVDAGDVPTGSDVDRLLRGEPDAVFLMMSEPAATFVVKQLRARKYAGSIILQSSMLQTYDAAVREPFAGVLQQKFIVNDDRFRALQLQLEKQRGQEVADDFVFSYDSFRDLLTEADACRGAESALATCLDNNMRDETWRQGASGRYRFMKDGSTERPMVIKRITANGFEAIAN